MELILNKLAAGQSVEQILEDYPQLTPEGVKAALKFAAESVRLDPNTSFGVQYRADEISETSPQE